MDKKQQRLFYETLASLPAMNTTAQHHAMSETAVVCTRNFGLGSIWFLITAVITALN